MPGPNPSYRLTEGEPVGPLSVLEGVPQEKKVIFPTDLKEVGNFIAFDIHQYRFRAREELERVNAIKTIFLPLPSNLSTQYSQGYNAEGVGPAGLVGASIGETSRNADNVVSSLIDKAQNLTRDDIQAGLTPYLVQGLEEGVGTAVGALFAGLPGIIAGGAAQQAIKGGLAGAGLARNPHLAMLYDGPEFRTHTFQYKFVPKNEQETRILHELIHDFKYHGAPGYVNKNSHFFDYPELFEIGFSFPEFLFEIAPSFLKDISVEYHGEGQPMYHQIGDTKSPVSVTVSLTFQEATIQTKDTIGRLNR